MKLISCHIENFGKLHDCSMHFDSGLNSFCRENGWGKSTFAAFLCVMFYGFETTTSSNLEKNDRKKYFPWQGGAYGGTVTFLVGSKQYQLTRLFGEKAVNDEFELRDADTNLLSSDYSEKIGEELFGINKESFARTVYIAQSKCETAVTDDMNAGIGKLTDAVNDMGSFETAIAQLTAKRNALTPKRVTGSLKKREAEISELARTVQEGTSLEESLERMATLCAEQEELLRSLQEQMAEISQMQKRASALEVQRNKKQEWERMRDVALERKTVVKEYREKLPSYLPSKEELQQAFDYSSAMERAALTAENSEFTEREADAFSRLQEEESMPEQDEAEEEETLDMPKHGEQGLLFIGILLVVAGAVLLFRYFQAGALLLAVGLILVVVAAVLRFSRRSSGFTPQVEELKDAIRRQEEELEAKKAAMAEFLYEKQQRFEDAMQEYDGLQTRLAELLGSWGLETQEEPETELKTLAENLEDYEDALLEYRGRVAELKEFEAGIDKEALRELESLDIPPIDAIQKKQQELEDTYREAGNRLTGYRRQQELLEERLELWEEQARRLEELRNIQEQEMKMFHYLTKAEEHLTAAKESMTSKYTDPLLQSFRAYYESIAGAEAPFSIDANTNITLWEQGKQRKTETLSAGMRDLVGICLRASFADAMFEEERPMLLLDDPFTNLDDEKTDAARAFLQKLSEKYQVIYFTCSSSRE